MPAAVDAFFLQHVDGASFTDSRVSYAVPRERYWGRCIDLDQSEHVDSAGLACINST